jgi:hypothetical protein
MPRYVVERTFPDGWDIPAGREGSQRCLAVVERNADEDVTWVHSYVSDDKTRTFCVYDAPSPEAIRKTAARNDLPVERITQVRVLDPYFYEPGGESVSVPALHPSGGGAGVVDEFSGHDLDDAFQEYGARHATIARSSEEEAK